MKTLAARKLGLVFKEASVKKINPQHEYHFFQKTFQEYLAALYLAHKLLEQKVNVFHNLKLCWNWRGCTKQECFSEYGEAEQMAMTLCSFIPFPQSVTSNIGNNLFEGVLGVANASKSFSQLQLTVHLIVCDSNIHVEFFFSQDFTALECDALQMNTSLHSFTIQTNCSFPSKGAAAIGDS
ncbi:unnamed protein product [Pocillopora meandrina]|uniref:Uncharacterized protein n=1 Tax=Pocillopora meandrina TaxID=46732 RepID=A0AAU9WCD5_9CNID|nr:unnamed protein product [Pocillopora meandrina]